MGKVNQFIMYLIDEVMMHYTAEGMKQVEIQFFILTRIFEKIIIRDEAINNRICEYTL